MTSSKSLRPWLKISMGGESGSLDLTMVVSMSSMSSFNIVNMPHDETAYEPDFKNMNSQETPTVLSKPSGKKKMDDDSQPTLF